MATADQFKSEFTRKLGLRGKFWLWYYGFCYTCRGQQNSTITYTLCPTCAGSGRRPFARRHTFLDWF